MNRTVAVVVDSGTKWGVRLEWLTKINANIVLRQQMVRLHQWDMVGLIKGLTVLDIIYNARACPIESHRMATIKSIPSNQKQKDTKIQEQGVRCPEPLSQP